MRTAQAHSLHFFIEYAYVALYYEFKIDKSIKLLRRIKFYAEKKLCRDS